MTVPGSPASLARLVLAALVFLAAACLAPSPAAAQDDYLARANAFYASIPQDKRSDLVLLPAVKEMDPLPEILEDDDAYALFFPVTSSRWPELERWIMAPAQRAALEALHRATEDEGPTTRMVFAQPYGYEGVDPDLVMAELYTELGDPPSLAAAQFLYLDRLDNLFDLAWLEATRLHAAGDGAGAMEVLLDGLFLARQIADRELAEEKFIGMLAMHLFLERLRDIAYQDFSSQSRSLTPQVLIDVVRRLDERTGPLGIERIRLPRADVLAVEQLLHQAYDRTTRKPNPATYSTVMARVSSNDRPLRLFSEAARWDMARAAAADWHTVTDALHAVNNDFFRRWDLGERDPVRALTTEYERSIRGNPGLAPIAMSYAVYPKFFTLRQSLRVEAGGTRMALAMYAYHLQHNTFPLSITAVRPNFAPRMDPDPHHPSGGDYAFFVPIRDQPKGPRGEPAPPHQIRVYPSLFNGAKEDTGAFAVTLRDDQFVIYSLGPDETRGWAKEATQSQEEYPQGDHLIWPPVMSLLRTHLQQQGRLD